MKNPDRQSRVARHLQTALAQALGSLTGKELAVTVGDTPGFLDHGGMMNFILEGSKVRFEIDLNAAEQAGLKISSKLINLAVAANK